MQDYLLIIIATVFANNFVLTRFLGLCPLLGVSSHMDSARGMALATMLVLTLASVSSYLLYQYVLLPLQIEYLATLGFIFIIAAMVQLVELAMRRFQPLMQRMLGIFLPLITSNCAVLGVALLNVREQHNLLQSALFGFAAAAGFGLVLMAFAAMRERLELSDVPETFRGAPIALVSASLMAMGFMGFAGMGQ
ncbi:MAG: electron transport complex subunit RsxA [Gammaproteobacteria bacterium]|nr:electron transport complex subunit RsxA [Gammaproteobacteria bacterium]